MKRIAGVLVSLLLVCFPGGCQNNSIGTVPEEDTTKYDMEQVVRDKVFSGIMEGKIVPVEMKYGIGGESGYEQYSTEDPEMIDAYIEAFKEIKIKEVITNQQDMIIVFDGTEDYTFVTEDGSTIVIGTYCSTYVCDSDAEYVLEHNEGLLVLNGILRTKTCPLFAWAGFL